MATILAVLSSMGIVLGVEVELLVTSGIVLGWLLLLHILVLGGLAILTLFVGNFAGVFTLALLVKETTRLEELFNQVTGGVTTILAVLSRMRIMFRVEVKLLVASRIVLGGLLLLDILVLGGLAILTLFVGNFAGVFALALLIKETTRFQEFLEQVTGGVASIFAVLSRMRIMFRVEVELLVTSGVILGWLLLLDILILGGLAVLALFVGDFAGVLALALLVKETTRLQVLFDEITGGVAAIFAVLSSMGIMLGVEVELLVTSGIVLGWLLLLGILILGRLAVLALFVGDFTSIFAFALLVKETARLDEVAHAVSMRR